MGTHLSKIHKITVYQYISKYIESPICPYCNTNKLVLYNNPMHERYRNGSFWYKHCSNNQCISKFKHQVQIRTWTEQQKDKVRKKRIEYLKKKTGKTAWEKHAKGQMTFLEKWFYEEVIIKYNLSQKYDICTEYCEFPYFIDFAFLNIKLAVQLDGKCHFSHGDKRLEHDFQKDKDLSQKGWKIFRIKYDQTNQSIIQEFLKYLNQIKYKDKSLIENRIYKYREVVKKPQHRSRKKYLQEFKEKLNLKNKPKINAILAANIDYTKFGWKTKIAKILNVAPQSAGRWLKKYMPEIYQKYSIKR